MARRDDPHRPPGDDGVVWVEGLESRFPEEAEVGMPARVRSAPSEPEPPRPSRVPFALGLLGSVAVGVLAGVLIYGLFLQPEPGPEPLRYVVARGDTLWKIARHHGVSVAQLQEWNQLDGSEIAVGQVLWIRSAETTAVAELPAGSGRKGRLKAGRLQPRPSSSDEAGLSLPPLKTCLKGPELDGAPEGAAMAASVGLSHAEVASAMSRFLPRLQRCIPPEGAQGTMTLELTVACTGRVAEVRALDGGGLPSSLGACVRQTLRYAEFPAHDMPDGFTFSYPLEIDIPGP